MAAPIVVTIARTNLDIKSMASLHENDVVWIGLNKESHIGRFEPSESIGEIRLFPTHKRQWQTTKNYPKVALVIVS